MDVVFYRHTVGGSDDLEPEAVEPASLAGAFAVVRLVLQEFTARNTHIMAHGYKERIDDVVGLGVQLFQGLSEGGEQGGQCVG